MTTKQSPSLPPQEQNITKQEWMEYMKPLMQVLHTHKPWDDRLSHVLTYILDFAPPEAHLRTTLPHPEAMKLVQGNYDLKKALEDTVQSWDYETLLSLPILQADNVQSRNDISNSPENMIAAFKAFKAPYVAGFPRALLKTVDKYYRQEGYNKSISIVQSSGTGKSRGVAETAQIRFSFLFNLRRDTGYYAYPLPDAAVRDYLIEPGSSTTRYKAFLCSLFENAQTLISSIEHPKETSVAFAKWWYKYLNEGEDEQRTGPNREKFYQTVVEGAESIADNYPKDKLNLRLEESCTNFVAFLRAQYKRGPTVVCLLIFDDAQEFAYLPIGMRPRERGSYHFLGSVLCGIQWQPVFSVFLSTISNLQKVVPRVPLHPSYRGSFYPTVEELYPSLTELPFDVFAQNLNGTLIRKHSGSLSAICTVPVMVCFGRALWYSLHDSRCTSIIEFAKQKLNPNERFFEDEHAQFECLAIRIGLDIDLSREIGRIRAAELVESYMRIVFVAPGHREYMHTGTPSEPVLAEAAAQLLNAKPDWRPMNERAPIILRDAFEAGFLSREERRRMVGRLLWTLAHDEVVRGGISTESDRDVEMSNDPDHDVDMSSEQDDEGALSNKPGSDPREVKYHKPIRVLDFLHALFHKNHWKTIDEAKPIGREDGKTLAEAFGNAYISFSHFMDGSDYDIDLHIVYRLLLRGAALNCQRNEPSIDFLTPILFGDPDSTIVDRSCTSVLQAQIKNDNQKKAAVDPTLVGADLPVLSLVHHLVGSSSSVEVTRSLASGQQSHPCHYEILSHGCTSETFGVIPSSLDVTYLMLLGPGSLMDDFSRADTEVCVSLLRQLQPCTGLERVVHEQGKEQGKKEEEGGVQPGSAWSWFGTYVE